jgi:hypothetical protein
MGKSAKQDLAVYGARRRLPDSSDPQAFVFWMQSNVAEKERCSGKLFLLSINRDYCLLVCLAGSCL